jgi:hypothetical protein
MSLAPLTGRTSLHEPIDLPPEVSAFIDAAVRRAAASAWERRPAALVPSVRPPISPALRMRQEVSPCFEAVAVVVAMAVLVAFSLSSVVTTVRASAAAEGIGSVCAPQLPQSAARPTVGFKLCDRLPH